MQFLDSEQLEYAFRNHAIDHEALARQFYTDLWDLIKEAEKTADGETLNAQERALRRVCKEYFNKMRGWQRQISQNADANAVCTASEKNRRAALSMLDKFERQFFRYALCYLELNRALVRMRRGILRFAQTPALPAADLREINHATGPVLMRAHEERHALMRTRARITQMRAVLQGTDPLMERLGEWLPAVFGHVQGDRQLTLFKGALRQQDFARARSVAQGWQDNVLRDAALRVARSIEDGAAILKAQEGLVLHSGELSLIDMFLSMDEAKADAFLEKLNVPYMVFQYRGLIHLGYALGRIGSLEGLIIHHAKLLMLAGRPHGDPERAHLQEEMIVVPARMMLHSKFKNLTAIFNALETAQAILEKLFRLSGDYRDLKGS